MTLSKPLPQSRINRLALPLPPFLLGLALIPVAATASNTAPPRLAFDVHVSLSEKAASTLEQLGEGIIVSASYSGDPQRRTRKYATAIGQISLGVQEIETPGKAGSVTFSGAHVHQNRLDWIKGPVLLNVNVYSARRRELDNILACDFFDGKLEDAVAHPMSLHCSLISEKAGTEHKS